MPAPTRPLVAPLLVALLLLTGCAGTGTAPTSTGYTPTASTLVPDGPIDADVPVVRVVDGDTVHVLLRGRDVTVRLIGIDTPETVKPDSPVECFGPEASEFAKGALSGQRVTLEYDATQGKTDRYGRTLAYLWIELAGGGRSLFNRDAVAGGYAQERQYGPTAYAWRAEFARAQQQAQAAGAGLWGACGS